MSAPTCTSCAHHVRGMKEHFCEIDTGKVSVITGRPVTAVSTCAYQRAKSVFFNRDRCGPSGKNWEPRRDRPLPPASADDGSPPHQNTGGRKS